MYEKYHNQLVTQISTIVSSKRYFGELENPQDGLFLKANLPIVYVDFIEDDTSSPRWFKTTFALYIVHVAYSKNEKIRINTYKEIGELLKDIYELLQFKSIENSKPCELTKLRKIFDAKTAGGYVTVYKKDVILEVPNPMLGDI